MALSSSVKESLKTALAMTITYAIALSLDWEKVYWAGFAVAFVSLSTMGLSFNKAAMRILGTVLSMVVALALLALFPQQRWLFFIALSIWMGFCTYMMGGQKYQYVWNICGFVAVIICMSAGPDPVNAFDIAILRAQETGLGVLVYSVVALLLWPGTSQGSFYATAAKLVSSLHRLFDASIHGAGKPDEIHQLRTQIVQQQAQFNQLLAASESDSYEVAELTQQWRRCQSCLSQLGSALEHWNESITDTPDLEIERLLPAYGEFASEVSQRFSQVEAMLAGRAPTVQPVAVDLSLDDAAVGELSPFSKAALAVVCQEIEHLESLSATLFASVGDVKGFGVATISTDGSGAQRNGFVPDPDRLIAVVRVVLTLWLAFLAVIFVNDIPGGFGLVSMTAPLAMICAASPQLSVSALQLPVAGGILFGAIVYIFLMPALSSFLGLGVVIFAATFVICYLFAAPKLMLARAFGLAMFLTITGISNEQGYNFLAVANNALMFCIVFLLLAITAYFPLSPRPERVIVRLLGRFFSSAHILASLDSGGNGTNRQRRQRAFHSQQVATVPGKLGAWANVLGSTGSQSDAAQVQALVASLQALSYRLNGLAELRCGNSREVIPQYLAVELENWYRELQKIFERLAADPATCQYATLRAQLEQLVQALGMRIRETINHAGQDQLGVKAAQEFYRLLGAFHSVSDALVNYSHAAETIAWGDWYEERFA